MDAHTDREVRTNETGDRKGLLEDLSLSQVLAGALAAVTSVALSSKIGIAGSLIGVAVASVVSTVASQLYRGMLRRANDKIRELAASDGEESAAESSNPYGLDRPSDPVVQEASGRAATPSGVRVAPAELRAAAHRRRQEKIHRRVIVAAVVSSLAAVAVSAGVVLLATNGEGLGQRTGTATQESEAAATTTEHHSALTEQTRPKTQQEPATSTSSSAGSSTSGDEGASGDATNSTTAGGDTDADQATTPEQGQTSTAASTATAAE